MGQFSTPQSMTPEQKENWNKFVSFVETQKMANNPVLDHRNKQVGMSLLQRFNYANPKNALPTTIIPSVQQEIHNYRDNLIQQWRAGKMAPDSTVKTEDDLMPRISPVDGWPGSKTLSHRFPVAADKKNGVVVKDYGTDVASFDKNRGLTSNK